MKNRLNKNRSKKEEIEEAFNEVNGIVNDILVKTVQDDGHTGSEEVVVDKMMNSVSKFVKTEYDSNISLNMSESNSLGMFGAPVVLKSETYKDNHKFDWERNDVKGVDFVTDKSIKLEDEYFQHSDHSLDIVGDKDDDFELEKVDVEFISGKETGSLTDSDHEISDSGKEVQRLFREVIEEEVDYENETDCYDEEEFENKICIVIKKESFTDFEQTEKNREENIKNIEYGRKTKKDKTYICDLCRKAFTSDNRLKRHQNLVHSDGGKEDETTKVGKYVCEVCSKRFISQSRLRLHVVTHTGEKPFSCDICGQKFSHPTNKSRHMKTHTGDKPYVCLFCGKSFPVKHYLKDHVVKHTGEKPHECKLCLMTFAHRFSLKQHELLKHPSGEVNFTDSYEDRPFTCEICGKKFTQQSSLKIHIRLHTGSKPYQCTMCSAGFIRSDLLMRHKLEHSGQRPFKCDICEKAFTSAYILKQHCNVHTGDRRQQCEHCGIKLANKESLARHMMRHTGESLLECNTCNKKFISKQSLVRHQQHPCEEKIYECKDCNYKNSSESKLKRHMLKHTAQKLLECIICKNKFTYPSNLKRHMKVHEKDHTRKKNEKETLISNDDVGKFIAESMKDFESDEDVALKPGNMKRNRTARSSDTNFKGIGHVLSQADGCKIKTEFENDNSIMDDCCENVKKYTENGTGTSSYLAS